MNIGFVCYYGYKCVYLCPTSNYLHLAFGCKYSDIDILHMLIEMNCFRCLSPRATKAAASYNRLSL